MLRTECIASSYSRHAHFEFYRFFSKFKNSKDTATFSINNSSNINGNKPLNIQNENRDKQHYRTSTSPSGIPLSKLFSVKFPLTIRESFQDYRSRNQLLKIQESLLHRLYELPNVKVQSLKVPIYLDSGGRVIPYNDTSRIQDPKHEVDTSNYINEVFITNTDTTDTSNEKTKHLVIVHGYGAGLGFFIKNIEAISRFINDNTEKKWCIHAIDLLGYGCSSRPEINYKTNCSMRAFEDWFIDSLETWRASRSLNIPENILFASHSLGAYLTLCYNVKYPKTFKKAILISPAAIIEPKISRFTKVPKWFEYLWNKNISPFALVRYTGPLGSMFVSGWSCRRFSKLTKFENSLLHKYAYAIFNAKGSGEYFLNYILKPGGAPRFPLINQFDKIAKINCDTEWLYGDKDWMNEQGGIQMSRFLREKHSLKSKVHIFKNCGHHLYLDDIELFNEYIIQQMKDF